MAERIRLKTDLDQLFPGKEFKIGSQSIEIKPLGIAKLASISKKLKEFGSILSSEGVTWDNYQETEHFVKIAVVLLDRFPEVLEEATNIAMEDLQLLPIDIIVGLLDTAIEVNIAAKDSLEKNFKSLAEKFDLKEVMPPQKKSK